jgi:hypothetical protein
MPKIDDEQREIQEASLVRRWRRASAVLLITGVIIVVALLVIVGLLVIVFVLTPG